MGAMHYIYLCILERLPTLLPKFIVCYDSSYKNMKTPYTKDLLV